MDISCSLQKYLECGMTSNKLSTPKTPPRKKCPTVLQNDLEPIISPLVSRNFRSSNCIISMRGRYVERGMQYLCVVYPYGAEKAVWFSGQVRYKGVQSKIQINNVRIYGDILHATILCAIYGGLFAGTCKLFLDPLPIYL